MQVQDWERVKAIFDHAISVPERNRAEYLRSACGEETSLRKAVQELLDNYCTEETLPAPSAARNPVFKPHHLIAERFRVVTFIDSGAMGEVYKVYDQQLQQEIALKTLRVETAITEDALDRFQREIRVARGLTHENLGRVFDYTEDRRNDPASGKQIITPCLTMELLRGESLAHYLSHARPLELEQALILIRQIAAGLDYLHNHGVVHRDLKPSNIMLTRDRDLQLRAVITDFGLAKLEQPNGDLFASRVDILAGAPYFMAPELFRGKRHTVSSDIYAFGLVIDEMVTTKPAFSATSLAALCFAKLWETPIPPHDRANLPSRWEETILRCLDREPAMRFERAGRAIAFLEDPNAPEGRRRRTSFGATVTVMVSVVVTLVFAAWLWLRPIQPSIDLFEIENRTTDSSYDYLSKGTTDELARRLPATPQIKLIPLHATRSQNSSRGMSQLAVDGEVSETGGEVRLVVRVIDNQVGHAIWSETFNPKQMADPVALQENMVSELVLAIQRHLLLQKLGPNIGQSRLSPTLLRMLRWFMPDAGRPLARPPTTSNAALDAYMRGQLLLGNASPNDILGAIAKLKVAIAEDPTFALAYASLADAHVSMTNYAYFPSSELLKTARQYAEMAVAFDPNLAEGYEALGTVQRAAWDLKHAEENLNKALALKPALAAARLRHAGLLLEFGRVAEARPEAKRAFEDDPYESSAATSYGLYLFLAGDNQDALSALEPAAQRKDALGPSHNLGDVYARLAQLATTSAQRNEYYRKAFVEAAKVERIERGVPVGEHVPTPRSDEMYAHYYSMQGDIAAAQPFLDRMISGMQAGSVSPAHVAWIYSAQNQKDKALDLIERAANAQDRHLLYIKLMPVFENLRTEPRFQKVLTQLGLQHP